MVAPWGPKGGPGSPKSDFGHILGSFWSPRGVRLGPFWPEISKSEGLCRLFGALFPVSEKGAKTGLPRGGHAIRPRRRMFREGRPSSLRLRFGLHFGVILGAKCATILLFGSPWEPTGPPNRYLFFSSDFEGPGRNAQEGEQGGGEGYPDVIIGVPKPPPGPSPGYPRSRTHDGKQ